MSEGVSKRSFLVFVSLTLFFLATSLLSCKNLYLQKNKRNKEVNLRLEAEEKVEKKKKDRRIAEIKLEEANKALEEEKNNLEAAKKAILEEQMVSQSLKDENQKLKQQIIELQKSVHDSTLNSGRKKYKK